MSGILVRLIGALPLPFIKRVGALRWRFPWLRPVFDLVSREVARGGGPIQQGVGKGLRFDPGPGNAGYVLGTTEPGVQRALASLARPGMTIYDIGANVGFFSVLAAHLVGSGGRVISFEPVPENAEQVRRNAQLNDFRHISVRREALGASHGTATFELGAEATTGHLVVGGMPFPKESAGRQVEVPIRVLDAVREGEGLPAPDLIKMDVEGAETLVLQGAARTLRDCRPLLMIELHGTNQAVDDALRAADYHAVTLESGSADIRTAPWDAFVLAAPRERPDAAALLSRARA
jgi:FkbM family methyltransferase